MDGILFDQGQERQGKVIENEKEKKKEKEFTQMKWSMPDIREGPRLVLTRRKSIRMACRQHHHTSRDISHRDIDGHWRLRGFIALRTAARGWLEERSDIC